MGKVVRDFDHKLCTQQDVIPCPGVLYIYKILIQIPRPGFSWAFSESIVFNTVVSNIFISVSSILFSPFVLVSDSFIFIVSMHINHSVPLGYIDIVSDLTALTSRNHLRTKVTPDFHLTYSKNGGNLGRNRNIKNGLFSICLHKIICCGCVLESPHRGDSNTYPKHMILWRTYDN